MRLQKLQEVLQRFKLEERRQSSLVTGPYKASKLFKKELHALDVWPDTQDLELLPAPSVWV